MAQKAVSPGGKQINTERPGSKMHLIPRASPLPVSQPTLSTGWTPSESARLLPQGANSGFFVISRSVSHARGTAQGGGFSLVY